MEIEDENENEKTPFEKKNVDNISDVMYKYYTTNNLPENQLLSGSFFFVSFFFKHKYNRKYSNAREVVIFLKKQKTFYA